MKIFMTLKYKIELKFNTINEELINVQTYNNFCNV